MSNLKKANFLISDQSQVTHKDADCEQSFFLKIKENNLDIKEKGNDVEIFPGVQDDLKKVISEREHEIEILTKIILGMQINLMDQAQKIGAYKKLTDAENFSLNGNGTDVDEKKESNNDVDDIGIKYEREKKITHALQGEIENLKITLKDQANQLGETHVILNKIMSQVVSIVVCCFLPDASMKINFQKLADIFIKVGLFDPHWYLERNHDVAKAGFDPIQHYFKYGALEGRPPCDLNKFLSKNKHCALNK